MQRKPKALTGSEFFNLRQSWTIELPRKMSEPFHYSLITLSSNKPLHNDLKWLKKQANPLKAQKKLAENGVQASTFSLKVNP